MSDPHGGKPFPPAVLYAAAGLLAATMVFALVSRLTGVGRTSMPEGEVAQVLQVWFDDAPDGAVLALDASGATIARFDDGAEGFLRGVLRGFARERKLEGLGRDLPFELTRYAGGRIAITDSATGGAVELNAFGRQNAAPFVRLLAQASEGEQR